MPPIIVYIIFEWI